MTSTSGWSPEPEPPRPESIIELIRRVSGDARAYMVAEAKRQKLRAGFAGRCIRNIAIAGVAALILLLGFMITLMIGLVWSLAAMLGPWGALAAVLGTTFAIIIGLGLYIRAKVKAMVERLKQ